VEHDGKVAWLGPQVVEFVEDGAIDGSDFGDWESGASGFRSSAGSNFRVVLSEHSGDLVLGGSLQLHLASVVEDSETLVAMGAGEDTDVVEVRVQEVGALGAATMLRVNKHFDDDLAGNCRCGVADDVG